MITKTDWDDALDAWVIEERERLDGPPTPEEVVRFKCGELSDAEAARVRALLVYYPELTPILSEPLPMPFPMPLPPRRSLALPLYAVAVTLALALVTSLLIYDRRKSAEPVVHSSRHELSTLRARGPAAVYDLPAGQQQYHIIAIPSEPPTEDRYQLEITRASEVQWSASDVRPLEDAFDMTVPGRFLKPGTYVLNIYVHGDGSRRRIDSYTFNVVRSP